MPAITEERALLVECYLAMREIAAQLVSMQGGMTEYRAVDELTEIEMLTEMRDALHAVGRQIGPALESPMIKQMLKMLRR